MAFTFESRSPVFQVINMNTLKIRKVGLTTKQIGLWVVMTRLRDFVMTSIKEKTQGDELSDNQKKKVLEKKNVTVFGWYIISVYKKKSSLLTLWTKSLNIHTKRETNRTKSS